MPDVRADGRFRVIQAEGNRTKVGTETAGWLLGDEFDMSDGPSIKCPAMLNSSKAGVPAGRMRVANWGKGLALPTGDPLGANGNWWSGFSGAGLLDERRERRQRGPVLVHRPLPGFQHPLQLPIRREHLKPFATRTPPTGQCKRTGRLWRQAGRSPRLLPRADGLSAEMRCAVWHQMIAGARGLISFEHSFGGSCAGDHHTIRTNCDGTRPMVISLDQELKTYAPSSTRPTSRATGRSRATCLRRSSGPGGPSTSWRAPVPVAAR